MTARYSGGSRGTVGFTVGAGPYGIRPVLSTPNAMTIAPLTLGEIGVISPYLPGSGSWLADTD